MSKKNINFDSFDSFARRYVPHIDEYIGNFYTQKEASADNADCRTAYRLIKEYCTRDGKRIRPLLLLLSYLGHGGNMDAIGDVIPAAASLECMHAFLLIQDDIIDGAAMRRGKPSFHYVCDSSYQKYNASGSWIAIVLADVLMSNAVEMVSGWDSAFLPKFLHEFSLIYERTALGQMLDILWSNPQEITSDDIPRTIAAMKTAHYTVSGPLRLGYMMAGGADDEELSTLREAGFSIGFAFQMRDDIISVLSDEKDSGKPSHADISEGKYTVLIQKTYELLTHNERREFISYFKKNQKTEHDIVCIKEYIRKSGAEHEVRRTMLEHAHKALTLIGFMRCNDDMKMCMTDFINGLFT